MVPRYRLTASSGSARLFAALRHAIAAAGARLAEPDRTASAAGPETEDDSLTLVVVAQDAATVRTSSTE
jgi:hypothetical protein